MNDATNTDTDRKAALEKNRQADERTRAEGAARMGKGKPTPTQEENDRAALGEHLLEHEDDGSGPDPFRQQSEAKKPTGSTGG